MAIQFKSQYDKRGFFKAKVSERWKALTDPKKNVSDEKRLSKIDEIGPRVEALDHAQIVERVALWREKIQLGEAEPEDFIEPGFAIVREAAKRVHGMFHYPEQILAGLALVRGGIAEMATGEGKTLAISLPAFIFALAGKGVHVITVNSYLAERDHEFSERIFSYLGMTAGMLPEKASTDEKKVAYDQDITYGVGYEYGFDYMRDQLTLMRSPHAQRGHAYAIVDEVDSVLIDEAGSPLVISEPASNAEENRIPYDKARDLARQLEEDQHFIYYGPNRSIRFTQAGRERIHELDDIPWTLLRRPWEVYAMNALRAEYSFIRDAQYVVDEEDKIVIIDEFTGRRHADRTWREGLHQAVESKEEVEIRPETDTAASITRQRFFKLYKKTCGLTGTAAESAGEFWRFFEMRVAPIRLHSPSQRKIYPERVFKTRDAMFQAVVNDVLERYQKGQPVLIGTRTIRESESLYELLEQTGVPFQMLTAKQDAEENDIVSTAGQPGQILLATNMAGRGTHISLTDESKAAGGLHVIAVERNDSVRVDRQLIGRGARQGQPGSAQFFVSAEDFIMTHYAPEIAARIGEAKGDEFGEVDGKRFGKLFDEVQEKVERLRYEQRLSMAERDAWSEKTRRNLA
ncbi:UNVERIFIED_CONTAM: hypothetical protein GTU68_012745 [Idotea baltica]|nr:hypothetical protein [Idotea baltica]